MTNLLNSESLKVVSTLYASKSSFKDSLDRLLHEEMKAALEVSDRLRKMVAGDVDSTKTTTVKKAINKTPSGKTRGRPKGSVNKPKAPKAESGEVPTEKAEAKITHGSQILVALTGKDDGLMASEILEAITATNVEGYKAPSKAVLQTVLITLKGRKVIKTRGNRPTTRYLLK